MKRLPLLGVVCAVILSHSSTNAKTLISNLDAPDDPTALLIGVRPETPVRGIFSMSFTVPSQDYEFENLVLRIKQLGNLPVGDPFVSIWKDDGSGFPGDLVVRLEENRPLEIGIENYTFEAPTLTVLEADTRYHVVVSNANNRERGAYGWVLTDPRTDPSGLATFESYRVFNNISGDWSAPIPARSKVEINVIADSDGDGVPDDRDACPDSILTDTIIIDGNDTGVANTVFPDGCTIADLLRFREEDAKNHGQFVGGVAKLAENLAKNGSIAKKEKSDLVKAAARSGIGK